MAGIHVSTTGDTKLKAAIDRSLDCLTGTMIKPVELAPSRIAALIDVIYGVCT